MHTIDTVIPQLKQFKTEPFQTIANNVLYILNKISYLSKRLNQTTRPKHKKKLEDELELTLTSCIDGLYYILAGLRTKLGSRRKEDPSIQKIREEKKIEEKQLKWNKIKPMELSAPFKKAIFDTILAVAAVKPLTTENFYGEKIPQKFCIVLLDRYAFDIRDIATLFIQRKFINPITNRRLTQEECVAIANFAKRIPPNLLYRVKITTSSSYYADLFSPSINESAESSLEITSSTPSIPVEALAEITNNAPTTSSIAHSQPSDKKSIPENKIRSKKEKTPAIILLEQHLDTVKFFYNLLGPVVLEYVSARNNGTMDDYLFRNIPKYPPSDQNALRAFFSYRIFQEHFPEIAPEFFKDINSRLKLTMKPQISCVASSVARESKQGFLRFIINSNKIKNRVYKQNYGTANDSIHLEKVIIRTAHFQAPIDDKKSEHKETKNFSAIGLAQQILLPHSLFFNIQTVRALMKEPIAGTNYEVLTTEKSNAAPNQHHDKQVTVRKYFDLDRMIRIVLAFSSIGQLFKLDLDTENKEFSTLLLLAFAFAYYESYRSHNEPSDLSSSVTNTRSSEPSLAHRLFTVIRESKTLSSLSVPIQNLFGGSSSSQTTQSSQNQLQDQNSNHGSGPRFGSHPSDPD